MTTSRISLDLTSNSLSFPWCKSYVLRRLISSFADMQSEMTGLLREARSFDRIGRVSIALSLVKFPLLVGILGSLVYGHTRSVVVLILVSMVVDILDGVVFSHSAASNDTRWTRARRLFDTNGDRILIGATILALYAFGIMDGLIALAVMIREMLLTLIVAIPYIRHRRVVSPNLASRCGTALIGVTAIAGCLELPIAAPITCLFLLFSIIGCLQYSMQASART